MVSYSVVLFFTVLSTIYIYAIPDFFSACLTGEKEYLSRFGFQIGIFRPAKKVDRYFSKKKKKGERQFLQNPPPLPPLSPANHNTPL